MNLPDEVTKQHDGAYVNDGFCHTAEQWDQFEEFSGRVEDGAGRIRRPDCSDKVKTKTGTNRCRRDPLLRQLGRPKENATLLVTVLKERNTMTRAKETFQKVGKAWQATGMRHGIHGYGITMLTKSLSELDSTDDQHHPFVVNDRFAACCTSRAAHWSPPRKTRRPCRKTVRGTLRSRVIGMSFPMCFRHRTSLFLGFVAWRRSLDTNMQIISVGPFFYQTISPPSEKM